MEEFYIPTIEESNSNTKQAKKINKSKTIVSIAMICVCLILTLASIGATLFGLIFTNGFIFEEIEIFVCNGILLVGSIFTILISMFLIKDKKTMKFFIIFGIINLAFILIFAIDFIIYMLGSLGPKIAY